MDLDKLKKIIEMFNEGGLTKLKIRGVEGDFEELELKKDQPAAPIAAPVPQPVAAAPEPAATEPSKPTVVPKGEEELVYVVSPLVGTFYTAPSPESPPYVKVGDHVDSGTIVCIVEAMKVMNEIESECVGTIVKVLVENAQPVEYGQKLFAIKPG
ncbi:acetyl-CoA carboxylase biotin carboxyl carrier protein [bacterium]|nr:acetyl-CoA carboxylase biotin carboxyl carrier protein [bacterium]